MGRRDPRNKCAQWRQHGSYVIIAKIASNRIGRTQSIGSEILPLITRPRRKDRAVKASAVTAAAAKLREIILQRGDGAYLGSQEDLIRLLEVGRVTLQQTARLLERERLLFVRRGVRGGYFARSPDEGGVAEAVGAYLRARHSGHREAFPVAGVLNMEMARLAARSHDEAGRAALREVGAQIEAAVFTGAPGELAALDLAHVKAVCRLAANPLGELMILVTRRLIADGEAAGAGRTLEDCEAWRRDRLNIIRAILARDEDFAELLSRQLHRRLEAGLPDRDEAVDPPSAVVAVAAKRRPARPGAPLAVGAS